MAKEKPAKFDAVKMGITGGIIWALLIFLVAALHGYFPTWFSLFSECYGFLGYGASALGMVVGLFCGFIDGFVFSWAFASIYNRIL